MVWCLTSPIIELIIVNDLKQTRYRFINSIYEKLIRWQVLKRRKPRSVVKKREYLVRKNFHLVRTTSHLVRMTLYLVIATFVSSRRGRKKSFWWDSRLPYQTRCIWRINSYIIIPRLQWRFCSFAIEVSNTHKCNIQILMFTRKHCFFTGYVQLPFLQKCWHSRSRNTPTINVLHTRKCDWYKTYTHTIIWCEFEYF